MTWIKTNALALVALVFSVSAFLSSGTTVVKEIREVSLGAAGDITNFTRLTIEEDSIFASTTATAFKVGHLGTRLTQKLAGTCTATHNGVSISATSTTHATCAVTNAASGDIVVVALATSTNVIANQWAALGARASSTAAGNIEIKLMNLTGTAAAPPSGILEGINYVIVR